MTSEMRPTDDELEAMAVRFSHAAEASYFLSDDYYRKTAAMLRACKGYDHSEWGAISFLADHNGEAYLREMKFRKAAEQALADMTRRRDRWKAIAEGQDFTRVYLKTCAERDALRANLDEAQAALRECMDEIDGYVRQEYPGDHPVHERYRKRDFSANPARVYFEYRKDTT